MRSYRNSYEDLEAAEIMRRVQEMDRYSSTILKSPPPAHMPQVIAPIITGFFQFGLGFSAATAGLLGSVTTAIVTSSVSAGIMVLP